MGGLDALLPDDASKFADVSQEFIICIQHASTVLGWYEDLTGDEMPPAWMWPFPDELDLHFDGVKKARKDKYSTGSDEDSDMAVNEL